MTRQEILDKVREMMIEMFELDAETVTLQAHLMDDLDLDSIDAIDMVVKLQEITGKRVDEERLKQIRTVEHIVDLVEAQLAGAGS
jgi:acyl carrier protein